MLIQEANGPGRYQPSDRKRSPGPWTYRDAAGLPELRTPCLLDRVRQVVLAGHLSHRTTYGAWIWPFLAALAVGGPNQQSAAQRPLLYKELLEARSSLVDGIVRAKRPEPLPVVLTREDIGAVPQRFDIVPRLMAAFLYGAGLRLLEWRGA